MNLIIFRSLIILMTLFSVKSSGQTEQVCISNFQQQKLRVSIGDIVKDPEVRIVNVPNAKIVSYRLVFNINGVIYSWQMNNAILDKEKIDLLHQVRDDRPKYNRLYIEDVRYVSSGDSIQTAGNLSLWLAQETNCEFEYDIKEEYYEGTYRPVIRYFLCNNTVFEVKKYRKDGTISSTRAANYKWRE